MPQFNPKRVLRHITNPLKREMFERQGQSLPVAWDRITDTRRSRMSFMPCKRFLSTLARKSRPSSRMWMI